MQQVSTLKFARWAAGDMLADGTYFTQDSDELPESLAGINIVMGDGDEARAAGLLARGAERVLLGELALRDSAAVERLVQQHGGERIGVRLAVKKNSIASWALAEETPNAGFRCMQPSRAAPCWEMLDSGGASTGTDSEWWLRQIFGLGVSMALVCADIHDDDLNICAGLNIEHEGKIWFTPLHEPDIDLEPWVRWGKVRQLLLPEPNIRDEAEMVRIAESAMVVGSDDGEAEVVALQQDNTGRSAAIRGT